MTLRARRIYYSLAILLFCVVAPLVFATAAGWRWSGWRQGFVGTGTLVITANPRATVFVNGKNVGNTPKRLSGITPGTYQLSLQRSGWRSWDHLIKVNRGASSTVGPVQLFRNTLPRTVVSTEAFDGFMVSDDQRAIAGWTTTASGTSVRLLWPTTSGPILLPARPDWIAVSQHRQRLAIGLADRTNVYSLTNQASPWSVPPGQPVFWLSSSESIFYRLEAGELIAYDLLSQARTRLQAAQSISGNESNIWLGRDAGTTTSVEQRLNTLSVAASTLASLPGAWNVMSSWPHGVLVAAADQPAGMLFRLNRLTGRLEEISVGQITGAPVTQTPSHPLWMNGVDILTLTDESDPVVLLRSPVAITSVAWIDPGDILATLDAVGLTIRSVSAQQGRETLIYHSWPADATPLLIDLQSQSAFFSANHRLQKLSWR